MSVAISTCICRMMQSPALSFDFTVCVFAVTGGDIYCVHMCTHWSHVSEVLLIKWECKWDSHKRVTWEALTWKEYTYRLSIKPVSPFITVNLKNLGHVTSGLNFLEPFTAIFRTWSVYNHVHRKCVKPLSFWPVCNGELLWVCFGCLRQAGSTLTVKCSPSQDYNDMYSFSKTQ